MARVMGRVCRKPESDNAVNSYCIYKWGYAMIDKEHFERFWRGNYNNIPPLGHVLRERFFNDRWFRIHSLPKSKRYADDEDEMKIILDRQNRLIDDLIGELNNYLLLLYAFSETATSKCFFTSDNAIVLDSVQLDKVLPDDYDTECYLNLFMINKSWKAGSIDDYLKAVANDEPVYYDNSCEVYGFLLIDIKQNRLIAPYDGGVDVFLNTTQEKNVFKLKYKDWLSPTESGL